MKKKTRRQGTLKKCQEKTEKWERKWPTYPTPSRKI